VAVNRYRVATGHVTDTHTGPENHFPSSLHRLDNGVVEDRHVTPGSDRSLDSALSPDDRVIAADIQGHA